MMSPLVELLPLSTIFTLVLNINIMIIINFKKRVPSININKRLLKTSSKLHHQGYTTFSLLDPSLRCRLHTSPLSASSGRCLLDDCLALDHQLLSVGNGGAHSGLLALEPLRALDFFFILLKFLILLLSHRIDFLFLVAAHVAKDLVRVFHSRGGHFRDLGL